MSCPAWGDSLPWENDDHAHMCAHGPRVLTSAFFVSVRVDVCQCVCVKCLWVPDGVSLARLAGHYDTQYCRTTTRSVGCPPLHDHGRNNAIGL